MVVILSPLRQVREDLVHILDRPAVEQLCRELGYRWRDGLLDPPISRYPRVCKAQPMTFNRPDFSSYCAHCAVWNSILPIEWYGHAQWVHTPPQKPEDPCVFHIYKDPRDIPSEYYRLFGKEKPADHERR